MARLRSIRNGAAAVGGRQQPGEHDQLCKIRETLTRQHFILDYNQQDPQTQNYSTTTLQTTSDIQLQHSKTQHKTITLQHLKVQNKT